MKTIAHSMALFYGHPGVFSVYSVDRQPVFDGENAVFGHGEVAEWLKALVSKTSVLYGAPRVRIPPSPLVFQALLVPGLSAQKDLDELLIRLAAPAENAESAFVIPVGPGDAVFVQIGPHIAIPLHAHLARRGGQSAPFAAI